MAVSLDQFKRQLVDSGLMSSNDIQAVLVAVRAEERPGDGEQLARLLIKLKKLTKFQAEQIYAGKGKALTLGNYVILDKLGQGGMGMVLKARHRRMDRIVALKVMSAAAMKSPDAVKRFHREAQAAARLDHSHIVAAYDADEANGTHFLVMQFVEGTDLSVVVKKHGPLPIEQAVDFIIQVARGLEFAHEQGVIHRDIKPANLLLDAKGIVKILDMGLARIDAAIGGSSEGAGLTSTGTIMGTVDYMSPEQAMDTKHADARSDIYSLGISLFYLLTGRVVYDGDTMMKKLMAHQHGQIPSLESSRLAPRDEGQASPDSATSTASSKVAGGSAFVSRSDTATWAAVNLVFRRMVAKRPEDRPQTMTLVIEELQRCLAGGSPTIAVAANASSASISDSTGTNIELQQFLQQLSAEANTSATSGLPFGSKGIAASPLVVDGETMNSAAGEAGTDPRAKQSMTIERSGRQKKKAVLLGSIAAAVVVMLAIVFAVRGKSGTLHLEITEELIEVTIGDTGRVVKGVKAEDVRLPLGEHVLHVKRNDLAFDTDAFEVTQAESVSIKVERVGRRVRAMQGKTLLGHLESPKPKDKVAGSPASPDFALEFAAAKRAQQVEIPLGSLDPNQPWTIEGYMQPKDQPDHNQALVVMFDRDAWHLNLNHWEMRLVEHSSKGQKKTENVIATVEVPRGNRVHVAGVFDGKLARLFVDGKLSGSAPSKMLPKQSRGKLFFGARFDGTMDEWRISKVSRYDKDFTPPKRYQSDADTLALYHFDEGTGEVLKDSSGNNHHGQIVGAKWVRENGATSDSLATLPAVIGTPFVILRGGAEAARHATLEEALDALQPQDVIEIHGNGPFRVGGPTPKQIITDDFTLKAAVGFRPLLVSAPKAAENHLAVFDSYCNVARFEDIDFVSTFPSLIGFQSGRVGAEVSFLRCRLANTSSQADQAIFFAGPKNHTVSFRDCLLLSARGGEGIRFLNTPSHVELTNTFVIANATALNFWASAETVKLSRCTLVAGEAIGWDKLQTNPGTVKPGTAEISHCLVLGGPRLSDYVRWQGQANVYGVSLYGNSGIQLTGNVKQSFEEWINSPAKPETGSKLVPTKAKPVSEFIDPDSAVMFRKLKTYLEELRALHPDVGADPSVAEGSAISGGVPIDLLAQVDLVRDKIDGAWMLKDGSLIAQGGRCKLHTPQPMPDEYDVELEIEQLSDAGGRSGGVFGFLMQGRQATVMLDAFGAPDHLWGIENVDGHVFKESKNPTAVPGSRLPVNQRRTVRIGVRRTGVRVTVNGEQVFDWRGRPEQLSIGNFWKIADTNSLFLGQIQPFAYHRITLTPIGTLAAAAAPARVQGGVIDLLPLVDVQRDAGVGNWKRINDSVACENPAGANVLQLPYEPPEEYDFEMEFTTTGNGLNVNQYVAASGTMFAWKLNSHNVSPPLYGFELLDGQFAKDNKEAATQIPDAINDGQRYRSTIEVRRGSLRTLLDGKELVKWTGDFKRLSLEPSTPMKHPGRIGIGSWRRPVTFHSVTVREVSGQGKTVGRSP